MSHVTAHLVHGNALGVLQGEHLGMAKSDGHDMGGQRLCRERTVADAGRGLAEYPGSPQSSPTIHGTGTAGLFNDGKSIGRSSQVTVADDRDVHGLDEPADMCPVSLPAHLLLRIARMQCYGSDTDSGEFRGYVKVAHIVVIEAGADLDGYRHAGGLYERSNAVNTALRVGHQLDAGTGGTDLRHTAAHIEVYDVCAGDLYLADTIIQHLRSIAKHLYRYRAFLWARGGQGTGLVVAVLEPLCGDHFTDNETGAAEMTEQAEWQIGVSGHRRENERRLNVERADDKKTGGVAKSLRMMPGR